MNQNNISLEKVIKGMEYHSEGNCFKSDDDETGCPYWKDSFCSQHLCSDVLALLKAQEPIQPIRKVIGCGWRYFCGKCGNSIVSQQHFCQECGQAVKWE